MSFHRTMAAGLLAALALLHPPAQADPPAVDAFHISPDGNDQNAGTQEKPFATVARARDAVRALKGGPGGALRRPVTVFVHGGTYFLDAPLVLTPDDSGTADAPVVFAAVGDDKPVLSGGRRVMGWKEVAVDGKRLWAADLPEVRDGKWYFHQLWVNGRRAVRARSPNDGFLQVAGLPGVPPDAPLEQGQDRFQFNGDDLKAWDNLEDVEVVALYIWVSARLAVKSVDEKGRVVTFAGKTHLRLSDGGAPARYYVENAFELLDSPGEWYLNRKTGVLYYWPRPGEKIAEIDAVAPVLPQLVRFEGKPQEKRYVEHVTFRGLRFQHAERWLPRDDPGDEQAAAAVPGAIEADGARDCALEDCAVAHVSGYAVHLARGCTGGRVTGCDLSDLGAGGVTVGETEVRDDPAEQTHDIAVTDNHIHDGGRVFPEAVGVWVGQSYADRVAHNHIHDLYYTGISCGWTWGYGKTLARDNVIEFNDVHDIGKEWLSDMGGVYTLGVQPGTVVRSNVFHDVAGLHYGGWGIYFDEGSTQITAENNLVYRTTHGGFHQHYGKENVVRNNVFALGRDAQLQRSRAEDHRSFTFEHNVVYYRTGELLAGTWDDEHVALDSNLYWRAGGGEVRFGDLTWDQWRAKGRDGHSLIADPLFEDPDKGDFRLKSESPASKVGYKAPDLSGVGPRPPGKRREGP